ncbi:FUSC family protein [Actinoplanes awajinensis]|uniref:FUSC family protein n=1 Tax=Actinoplanes awajinensis TaxID=135946 RepID=UPI001E4D44F4|nr:aromatic acid exporter family protein [Actinoplanes awajinensis]
MKRKPPATPKAAALLSSFHPHLNPITVVAASLLFCALTATLLRRKVRPAVAAASLAVRARLRPHLPAWVRQCARLCGSRLDPAVARSALVTAVAAGIAWSAAGTLQLAGPVTAAVSATLSVQMSSHASVREGAKRLVGTLAGIAITVAVWGTFGLTPWTIAVITGCGLAAGRLLRLGDSSVTVPLTSLGILVAGSAVTETFVWERIAATALGIVVGVILSPLVGGMTPLERARWQLAQLSTGIAGLLGHLGAGARDGYAQEQSAQWLARSRDLGDDLDEAVTAVDDLLRQARWSLTTPVTRVTPLQQTVRALEHGVHQVNSVARSMFDASATPHAPGVPEQIGQVLTAASDAFAAHAALVADPRDDATRDAGNLHDRLETLRDSRQRTLRKVRTEIDDTGVLVLTGSIITDIDRMAGSLERSAPALTVGVREPGPGIPAVSEVLPAVRLIWQKHSTR